MSGLGGGTELDKLDRAGQDFAPLVPKGFEKYPRLKITLKT